MLKFEGRTTQKITIPGKSIPIGFKIFALGDFGYTYNWEYIKSGLVEGVLTGKKQIFIKIPNSSISTFLNLIQSIIIRLIKCLSIYIEKGLSFYLFLDNLCIYWKSATPLKERGISVTGTVRKGASGYPPRLLQLKKANRGLIWGELQAFIIGGVCYWLWQDLNAVIDMLFFFLYAFFNFLLWLFSFPSRNILYYMQIFFLFLNIYFSVLQHYYL
jgi:Transposase IS4